MRNVFGDQGNMERNFWEEGTSVKVNFGEHLNLFLRNKGTTVNFHSEQGNMHPPWEALISSLIVSGGVWSRRLFEIHLTFVLIFKNSCCCYNLYLTNL